MADISIIQTIELDISQLDIALKGLGSRQLKSVDEPEFNKGFITILKNAAELQILSGGSRSGDVYEELKDKDSNNRTILIDTGSMFKALSKEDTYKPLSGSQASRFGGFRINHPYMKFHQFGTRFMSERKIFALIQSDIEDVRDLLSAIFKKKIEKVIKNKGNV